MRLTTLPSWMEKGQMIHVEDHATNVIRDIRQVSDRLDIYWNDQSEEFDIVERCLDGAQRLVFSTDVLDERVVQRLRRADHWYGSDQPTVIRPDSEDFTAEVDAFNDKNEEEWMEAGMEKVRAAGEELAWALDVTRDRPSVGGSISVPRDING